MMTTILLAVHLAAAEPAPQLLVEVGDPKLTKDFHLLDVRGKAKYEDGHVPGAVLAEIGPWSKAVTAGKADAVFWKAELAKVGVNPQKPVVVYSDDPRDAARVWWMLEFAGVPDARVLNGGWKAYTAAKLPVQKEAVTAKAEPHDWKPAPDRFADKKLVLEQLKAGVVIVDARTKEEYAGESKLTKKAGHIPGAVHLEWVELIDAKTGKYLPRSELIKLVKERKIDLDKPAITYCQSGGRSAVAAFGLELAGAKKVRNYYASWGEWGNADDTPVELPKK
jgi:thiosulfate/3-mercaptopyruvate sulfurtransferase